MRLTKPQKLIYEMEKFAGGSVSVICGSILINGNKDVPLLQKAINELYRLNDALRISVAEVDGVPEREGNQGQSAIFSWEHHRE